MKEKYLISALLTLILLLILYINIKLYFSPEIKMIEGQKINYDLLCELRGLQEALNENADQEMQQVYPEGYLFFNVLYGLSWCEFVKTLKSGSTLYKEGHVEIQRAFDKIDSDRGRSIFDESLDLPYGSFYTGWSTYLLGKKLAAESTPVRDQQEIHRFQQQCDRISAAIQRELYPESYAHQAWPADVVVCVASLSLHDRLFRPKYSTVIREWLGEVKQDLDPIGLIPHAVQTGSGKSTGSSRGSSQSLMLNFLKEIDIPFAEDQFDLYKQHFLDYRLGLPGIREYPKENAGAGDIDSGPVIAEIGAAATIVGFKTMNAYGETALGTVMRNGIEAFGLPVTMNAQKKYLFGTLPMADAFIAWGHSSESGEAHRTVGVVDFFRFHLYSAGIAFPFIVLLVWLLRRRVSK